MNKIKLFLKNAVARKAVLALVLCFVGVWAQQKHHTLRKENTSLKKENHKMISYVSLLEKYNAKLSQKTLEKKEDSVNREGLEIVAATIHLRMILTISAKTHKISLTKEQCSMVIERFGFLEDRILNHSKFSQSQKVYLYEVARFEKAFFRKVCTTALHK